MKVFKIVLGSLFILSVIYAYWGIFSYMYECTCISNLLCGIVLICDGVFGLFNKKFPNIMYHFVLPCICGVYLISTLTVTILGEGFNFSGGMMLLHATNPIIFLLMYLFAKEPLVIKNNKHNLFLVFTSPLCFMSYLLFDLFFYVITGKTVYGLLGDNPNLLIIVLVGIIAYIFMLALSFGLITLKKYVDSKIIRKDNVLKKK